MTRYVYECLDGHTCGNPVRLIIKGAPDLSGETMSEKRQDFIQNHDWIRQSLMYEPRGHDLMSGAILYPSTRPECQIAILYIEVSGCLPMCGHGTIGAVTMAIENNLIETMEDDLVRLDTPAGVVKAHIRRDGDFVDAVRIHNVPSFLAHEGVKIICPDLGELEIDIAYGGNFYAIIDPQKNYEGLEAMTAADILHLSPLIRDRVNEAIAVVHPLDKTIRGVSHIQWTGAPREAKAQGRNAVFYGANAIDRSPCGTGTSARLAQLVAKGRLKSGDDYIHESIIGTLFSARVEEEVMVGNIPAILPSVEGWARQTGKNTIFVDDRDPLAHGFQLT